MRTIGRAILFLAKKPSGKRPPVLACPDPGFDVCDWLHASSAVQGYRRTRWRDPEHASPVGRYFSRTVNHPFETAEIAFAYRRFQWHEVDLGNYSKLNP